MIFHHYPLISHQYPTHVPLIFHKKSPYSSIHPSWNIPLIFHCHSSSISPDFPPSGRSLRQISTCSSPQPAMTCSPLSSVVQTTKGSDLDLGEQKMGQGMDGRYFFLVPWRSNEWEMNGIWVEYEWNMSGIWIWTEYGIRMVPWVEPMFWFNVPKLSSECHLVSLVSLVP